MTAYALMVRQALTRLGFCFQAEDGIRDHWVTGVQTCALPIRGGRVGRDELKRLGAFGLAEEDGNSAPNRGGGGGTNAFLTRLHVRYDREHFPEDLVFQSTGDRTNFQARYVLHHPWTGESKGEAVTAYLRSVRARQEQEAGDLAGPPGL